MTFNDSLKSVLRLTRRLFDRVRDILPHWRTAIQKPAALTWVAITAYRAHIAFFVLLVFMIFIAPGIINSVTNFVFPPETSMKVFGLIKTQQASPLQSISFFTIMTILWLGSIVSVLLLFWFHLPRGLALANARARMLADESDSTCDKIRNRVLCLRALALATDPALESEIKNRLTDEVPCSATATTAGATEISAVVSDKGTNLSESMHRKEQSPSSKGLAERYELREQIGSGAMGVVFGAYDMVLDRKVAVKQLSMILSGDDEYIFRFRREAKALARLNHPNVVQVYDLVEEGLRLWMVVEYVDGGDLASYLKQSGRLSVSEAAGIVASVAGGLAFAHDQGIVHRDLKPANILLTAERVPKITDFGIAKLSQTGDLTQTGSVLGSPPYMSPEQCSGGSVDSRTDIYALGITLFELLAGKKPFDGDTSSVMARHIVEPPPSLSEYLDDIPPDLEELISQMLAKNPDDRPSDMTGIVDRLSIFMEETVPLK